MAKTKVSVALERVTPQLAEKWLNGNTANRPLRSGVAERYAQDMKNNQWTRCTAPIVFYDDDSLADGQHRLHAVVESGEAQDFTIMRNVSKADGLNIDTGLGRNLSDAAKIAGLSLNASNRMLAASRGCEEGNSSNAGMSNSQKLLVLKVHEDACAFAIHSLPTTRHLCSNTIASAVARAWYSEKDKTKLMRYCQVLATGFADGPHESAAIAMRNYMLTKGSVTNHSSMWRDTFLKVMNSIHYFMRGKQLTVIKGVAEEAYPLKHRIADSGIAMPATRPNKPVK